MKTSEFDKIHEMMVSFDRDVQILGGRLLMNHPSSSIIRFFKEYGYPTQVGDTLRPYVQYGIIANYIDISRKDVVITKEENENTYNLCLLYEAHKTCWILIGELSDRYLNDEYIYL
jgi:hypothetical protein